ncbi:MAG: 23S rRNA (uracil(1939)-C(5))-methyltransferase RlmD [Desulfobacterales bacterium]
MSVRKGEDIDASITEMAFGGRGLCRIDSMVVFVDQAVPGDRARIRIIRKKKNHAEARILELLEASPDRVEAPCPYSGVCGGCKWQFLAYPRQVEYKRRHVEESLRHIGGIEDVLVHPTLPSELIFGYRNKMEFSCADQRWLMPDELGRPDLEKDFALGLHVPGTFHKVLDTQACLLQPELGNRILGAARDGMKISGRPPYGLKSHEGFWRFLMLRHSVAFDQWMVNLITASEDREAVDRLAAEIRNRFPRVVSVVNNITARKAAVAIGEREVHLAGTSSIRDRIGPYEFEISSNSFFQTNTRGALRLYETVRQYAGLSGEETVVDLYCGTGTIAIFLSSDARSVVGLEIVESAVRDADANCRLNGVTNCRFVLGDIRQQLAGLPEVPDVMIIDPPRDGMHKDVVRQVIDMAPKRVVYVSCNPATLARDLLIMKERYQVCEVQPVDLFPHTWHIEAVARLERIPS